MRKLVFVVTIAFLVSVGLMGMGCDKLPWNKPPQKAEPQQAAPPPPPPPQEEKKARTDCGCSREKTRNQANRAKLQNQTSNRQ